MKYCKRCGKEAKPNTWQEGYYCSNCGNLSFDDVNELYDKIKSEINNWEDYKKEAYNEQFATTKNSKKLQIQNKFEHFTDDELYMLKRQAIESSCKIVMSGRYNDYECKVHNQLINEIIDEIKRRG